MDPASRIADPEFFARIRLFADVRPAQIEVYLDECSGLQLSGGEIVLHPEQENRFLYVVSSGTLEVRVGAPDGRVIKRLGPGDCAGELSMIDQRQPAAYVVASGACELILFAHDTVWAMLNASHAVARNLLALIGGHVRRDNSLIGSAAVIRRRYEQQAISDPVTGLHNRRWMEDLFAREIARCLHSQRPACLVLVDIDRFRGLNCRYGHLVGDHALGFVAERLLIHFRADDLVARYGGDEFAVLLPEIDLRAAQVIADRVRVRIAEDRNVGVRDPATRQPLTVSMGLAALLPQDDLKTLLERADQALYRAKKSGRNRVCS